MSNNLANKTILVAGAGGLIGSNLVNAILAEEGEVVACDINLEVMQNRLAAIGVDLNNTKLTLVTVDITNTESVANLFTRYELDGAVNATYPRNKTYGAQLFDVTLESFNENLSLHLGSSFLFNQQAAAYFKRTERPLSVINFSSIYGVVAPKFEIYAGTKMSMPVEYAAIKSAIQHITKYMAVFVNDSRFRVNCISPGGILDAQPEPFLNAYKQQTNGKGMLDVQDLMGTLVYLLSDMSKYVTGQNIVVDDGFVL